jgi:hypothetical protein
MARKRVTVKNFERVLPEVLRMYAEADRQEKIVWADELNDMLDTMRDGDFFGTDGQCDPRGDNRD